jgi:hypothetical protein
VLAQPAKKDAAAQSKNKGAVDWQSVVNGIVKGADQGQKQSTPPKERIAYADDEQLGRELTSSMKARMPRIRVDVPGLDTQEMVSGVIVFSKVVKETGGKIIYCDLQNKESTRASPIAGLILPTLTKPISEAIAAEIKRAEIPSLAKQYHLLVYVRDDKRTSEYIVLRKRDIGDTCEPAAESVPKKTK